MFDFAFMICPMDGRFFCRLAAYAAAGVRAGVLGGWALVERCPFSFSLRCVLIAATMAGSRSRVDESFGIRAGGAGSAGAEDGV